MILVDSSAWIEFQRETGSHVHLRLRKAIQADEQLATTGMVVLEVLAGARDDLHEQRLRRFLASCRYVRLHDRADHDAAAALYRECRRRGTTIRRLPDCLIATVAMRVGAALLHHDRDFDAIARHAPLQLVD